MNNKVIAIRKKLMVQRDELLSEAEHTINTNWAQRSRASPIPRTRLLQSWTTTSC